MSKNLKSAFFSALLVLAVAYPVLGLKLEIVGVNLTVLNASSSTIAIILGSALVIFLRVLFHEQIATLWRASPGLPVVPAKASNFLTLPSTQRWIILAMVMVALVWPFFGSRGAVTSLP